mmetsp:Transcript_1813/g.3015  ORF Transcript_1813/g.3015 Transcript_1813/m.3015 type:complete len:214 (-) Transcript_1813:757-1398(-)
MNVFNCEQAQSTHRMTLMMYRTNQIHLIDRRRRPTILGIVLMPRHMCVIVHRHHTHAVRTLAKRAVAPRPIAELGEIFLTTGRTSHQIGGTRWIVVGVRRGAVVHAVVVHWEHALVLMLMRTDNHVDATFAQDLFQVFLRRRPFAVAFIAVFRRTIQRTMTHGNNPRHIFTITIGFSQIIAQPFLHAILHCLGIVEMIDFSVKCNDVCQANVH